MRRIAGLLSFVLLLACALAPPAAAQSRGTVTGRVTGADGAPVAGARVTARGTTFRAATDAAGAFTLSVPAGTYTLVASAPNRRPVEATVTVAAGASVSQAFALQDEVLALDPVQAIVGSRARHTAADELAVPVDVIPAEAIAEAGLKETTAVLATLAPSINYPHQSVSDATDIVRPFTMRGLSPDHTLVLLNGKRYHRTSLIRIFGAGTGAGSGGVDMNAIPSGSIERVEVLRDGAAAQYGSDAIAGVVNVVLKRAPFRPFVSADLGQYAPGDYDRDGRMFNVTGGAGFDVGLGSVSVFGEYRDREPTNRASDEFHHWGDGSAKDLLSFVNAVFPLNAARTAEAYAYGGFSRREGTGNGYFRYPDEDRNLTEIYPNGFLPTFAPDLIDYSANVGFRGARAGWNYDVGGSIGHNTFEFNLENTLNSSLGPCLQTACAPGLDGVFGNADDPGIPNQTSFDAGTLKLTEMIASVDVSRPFEVGLHSPLNLAAGIAFRHESFVEEAGERASWIQGGYRKNGELLPAGSQVFPGFRPADAADESRDNVAVYADLEANLSARFLATVAGRFENYSDFGSKLTGKLAMRFQPSEALSLRTAVSTGFRAPSLSQSYYSSAVTNAAFNDDTQQLEPFTIGIFRVDSDAARLLGARDLKEETSVNWSGGFAATPFENFNLSVDAFFIRVDDRILLTTSLDEPAVRDILRDAGLDVDAAQYFTNAIDTDTRGVDVTASYRMALGERTDLDLGADFNYTRTRIRNKDNLPLPEELEGTGEVLFDEFGEGGLLAIEKERPEWKGSFTARLRTGPWRAMVKETLYGTYTSALYCYCESGVQTYPSEGLFDAELGYAFGDRGTIAIGAKNLFDNFPGRMSEENGFGLFPYPPASPFGYNGRYVYTRIDVKL
jgi:iron complex outermembrane receptor protein